VSFPLLGQYVSVDLANSCFMHVGRLHDALADVSRAQEWTDAVGELALADGGTLAAAVRARLRVDQILRQGLVDLRSDVRDLFFACARGEVPQQETVKRLSALAAAAPRLLHAVPSEGALVLERRRAGPAGTCALAALAEDALVLAGDPAVAARLFECASPGCIGVLLRADPRTVYCSTRCATRDRVARHAARAKADD
jgi:hypothetical protein